MLVLFAGFVGLQANAQHRNFGGGGWKQRDNSPSNGNNERRVESRRSPDFNQNRSNDRWQQNRGQDQSNNRWQQNREPRQQNREPRQQNPVAVEQNNRWRSNGNSPERRVERRPEQQTWASNDNRNNNRERRFGNNGSYGNNNGRNGNRWNAPRAASYDRFRRSNWQPTYNRYNPGWRYSYLPRRNSVVASFSFPFATIAFGGYSYRYCDGVYYRPYNNVYRVCAAPVGIYINVLPFGYRRIVVNDYPYYYYNGTYYEDYEESYRVIAPPVGAVVESIPDGYETIVIDGETYYSVDDVQYKPVVVDNGEIWYEVIKVG